MTVVLPRIPSAPLSVDVSLTGRCNLRCRYCFYADEMTARDDLTAETWAAVFAELGSIGVRRVCLSGGEVLTRVDFFQLVDAVVAGRLRYSVLTNGTLVTERTVAELLKGKRRLRLDSIQVSIDGSTAEVHDRSRPPNSFERALRGLRLLKGADLPVTVRVTVNRNNLEDLPSVARLLLEDVGVRSFSTNEAEPMGTARCGADDVVLSAVERRRAMALLSDVAEAYPGRVGASAGPLASAREFAAIEQSLARGETGKAGRGMLASCHGVFVSMGILHDGTMVPCNMLPSLAMGKVGEVRIQDAWLSHPAIASLRRRSLIPLQTLESCRDCDGTGFCSGGCPAGSLVRTGCIDAVDPQGCWRLSRLGEPQRDTRRETQSVDQ